MPLKAVIEKLDGLPADVAKEYVQKDGKFHLNVEPIDGYALENVRSLRTALDEEREGRKTDSAKIKQYEGLDPEKARDALKKLETMKDWKPEDKVREHVEQQLNAVREKMGKDITDRDGRIKSLLTTVEEALISTVATNEITRHKGVPELLMPAVRSRTKVVEQDGKFTVRVLDASGNPAKTAASNYAKDMTVADLVEELRSDAVFSRAFEPSGSSGSGSSSGNKGGGSGPSSYTITREDAKDMNKWNNAVKAANAAGTEVRVVQ